MKLSRTLIIFSLLMVFILNVNMASALEFDNVKDYDPISREVTITNSFGLGADIGKARLNTPLNVKVPVGYQKVAEFDIWAYQDYSDALKQFEFKDMKNGKVKINRDYDLKYKDYEDVLVDDYKTSCYTDSKSFNKTQICEQIKVGSHYEKKEVWKKVSPADLKKNEVLTIGVFTEVQKGDYVDWIPSIYGVKVEEWATWSSDLSVGLNMYWNMDNATNINDLSGNGNDGTNSGTTATTGKIGNALDFERGDSDYIQSDNKLNVVLPDTSQGTINLWFKAETIDTTSSFIFENWGGGNRFYADITSSNGIIFAYMDNSATSPPSWSGATTGTWYMLTATFNSSGYWDLWINGIKRDSETGATDSGTWGTDNWGIGKAFASNNRWFDGVIDEVGVWNRQLSEEEIGWLYNSGDGCGYGDDSCLPSGDNPPTITLNSPSSANYTSSQNITINLTASDDINLSDIKLYINTALNQTNATGLNNTVYLFDLELGDGDYDIYGKATDNASQETNSDTITIIIDSQSPTINITYPLNGSEIISYTNPTSVDFNASISDAHLSTCWYYNGTANVTVTCGENATLSLDPGTHNLAWYANDTLGNEASSYVSFFINYIQENASYPDPAIEAETYPINLTINATELNNLSGTLYYNGTTYNATSSVAGDVGTLNTNLFIEPVTETTLKSFYWNYTLNGINYSSSTYNHTIYFITPINVSASCSAGLASAMCFDFKDEMNLTALSGNIDYNFKFGISNSSLKEVYGSLTNASDFCLCVNSTVYNNYTLGEGEIQYSKTGYADRRFYTFSTQRLSNETINNTLYLLPSTSATSFLFDFKDTNLAPYINRYTTLLRWYPNLNQYKIVEMAKTDDKGETIMRVQTEDVDYRVGLYERNGSLITLLNPVRFACISAPCSYSSLVDSAERDYTSFFDVEGSIVFNETTNIWTLTWNDPTQNTQSMNLLVTRERGDSSFTICDVSADGFTGILTCDSTGYTGTLVAKAYRTASPATPIFQKIVNTLSSPFASQVGLFFAFILVALLMLIGVYSPVASVILGILALLPALYMGVITLAIFIAIAVLGGIIIHFMKRTG